MDLALGSKAEAGARVHKGEKRGFSWAHLGQPSGLMKTSAQCAVLLLGPRQPVCQLDDGLRGNLARLHPGPGFERAQVSLLLIVLISARGSKSLPLLKLLDASFLAAACPTLCLEGQRGVGAIYRRGQELLQGKDEAGRTQRATAC